LWCESHADGNGDGDTDGNCDGDSYSHSYSNGHGNCHSHGDRYGYFHPNGYVGAEGYSITKTSSDTAAPTVRLADR